MLDLFGKQSVVVLNFGCEFAPGCLDILGLMVVAGGLKDPFLFHQNVLQFLLHLFLPHLHLQVHCLALMRLLQSSRLLRQLHQTILQEIPHLIGLVRHGLPQTVHHLLQEITQELVSCVLELDLADGEAIHSHVVGHLLELFAFHPDDSDVELPLLDALYLLVDVFGGQVGDC